MENMSNNIPLVSVIVPVYKVEAYLPTCIESILKQIFSNFELILVDDGSPDCSGAICDEYAKKDNRIIVIHKENAGVSSARNAGIAMSKGKYLAFIDSDDSVDPEFLQNAVNDIEYTSADLYLSGLIMETWKKNKITNQITYHIHKNKNYSIKDLFENLELTYPLICICGPWCKLYQREIIDKAHLRFDEAMSFGEDTYFNLQYLTSCSMVTFSSDVFYHYRRINADSLFSKIPKDIIEIYTKVYDKMQDVMSFADCNEVSTQRFQSLYVSLLIGGIHSYFREGRRFSKKEKMDVIRKVGNHHMIQNPNYIRLDWKNSFILYLLKKHHEKLVWFIFQIWYCLRHI